MQEQESFLPLGGTVVVTREGRIQGFLCLWASFCWCSWWICFCLFCPLDLTLNLSSFDTYEEAETDSDSLENESDYISCSIYWVLLPTPLSPLFLWKQVFCVLKTVRDWRRHSKTKKIIKMLIVYSVIIAFCLVLKLAKLRWEELKGISFPVEITPFYYSLDLPVTNGPFFSPSQLGAFLKLNLLY